MIKQKIRMETQVALINKFVLWNMRYTNKTKLYQSALTVQELKRLFWEQFKPIFNNEEEEKRFINGAKHIDFELIFKIIK